MRVFILLTSSRLVQERRGVHARFLVASLMISRSIRRDAVCCLYLRDAGYALLFYGSKIRQLRADEPSAFGIINKAIKMLGKVKSPHSGVYILQADIRDIVRKFYTDAIFVRDDKHGKKISEFLSSHEKIPRSFTYITYVEDSESTIEPVEKCIKISFPKSYSPEQEVVILNMLIDNKVRT